MEGFIPPNDTVTCFPVMHVDSLHNEWGRQLVRKAIGETGNWWGRPLVREILGKQ